MYLPRSAAKSGTGGHFGTKPGESRGGVVLVVSIGLALMLAVSACGGGSGGHKPASPSTLLAAGIAAQQKGNVDAARQLFEQVVAKEPNNVYAHYNLGVIAQQQNASGAALQEYGKALAANPRYVPALFNEATIWGTTDPTLAIATYRQIVQLQPQAPTAYLNLGLLEEQTGQHKKALAHLLTALHQDPTLVDQLPPKLLKKVGAASPSTSPSSSVVPSAAPSG